jgi:hypothetical protein
MASSPGTAPRPCNCASPPYSMFTMHTVRRVQPSWNALFCAVAAIAVWASMMLAHRAGKGTCGCLWRLLHIQGLADLEQAVQRTQAAQNCSVYRMGIPMRRNRQVPPRSSPHSHAVGPRLAYQARFLRPSRLVHHGCVLAAAFSPMLGPRRLFNLDL